MRRLEALSGSLRTGERPSRKRGTFSLGPAACVLAGLGSMMLALAAAIELSPRGIVARLLVMACAGLPFGG